MTLFAPQQTQHPTSTATPADLEEWYQTLFEGKGSRFRWLKQRAVLTETCDKLLNENCPPIAVFYAMVRSQRIDSPDFFDDFIKRYQIDVNQPLFLNKQTAAHILAQLPDPSYILLLYNNGADLTKTDDFNLQPIDYAKQNTEIRVSKTIQKLLNRPCRHVQWNKPEFQPRHSDIYWHRYAVIDRMSLWVFLAIIATISTYYALKKQESETIKHPQPTPIHKQIPPQKPHLLGEKYQNQHI